MSEQIGHHHRFDLGNLTHPARARYEVKQEALEKKFQHLSPVQLRHIIRTYEDHQKHTPLVRALRRGWIYLTPGKENLPTRREYGLAMQVRGERRKN